MRNFLAILGIFFLAPVLVTLALNGYGAISVRKELPREEYLPQLLYRDIPAAYEEEALKAQAVLERSSLFFYSGAEWRDVLEDCVRISRTKEFQAVRDRLSRVAEETEGVLLTKNGQAVRGISHRISGGRTRNGAEVTELPGYGDLISVESSKDTVADGFLQTFVFDEKKLMEIWQTGGDSLVLEVAARDSAEYATEVCIGDVVMGGEAFREAMGLSSACFMFEKKNGQVVFTCRGWGHGLGMSQYGASQMALGGADYIEILQYYFPNYEIIKK
ncbi:MAG TPA: hypothetical protein DF613_03325 [Lachnospiraceae bacterium]|nr:hypothetical protein [Lachnospiraceae bacterium]